MLRRGRAHMKIGIIDETEDWLPIGGLDTDSKEIINFTMGSYAKLLNVTTY